MAFRIAGADDVEFRGVPLDEGYEIAGMFEDMGSFAARRFVAPQGQDIFDARLFQLVQRAQGVIFGQVDTGHMSRRFAAVGVLDSRGHFDGAVAAAAASAGAAGDADEIGMKLAQLV